MGLSMSTNHLTVVDTLSDASSNDCHSPLSQAHQVSGRLLQPPRFSTTTPKNESPIDDFAQFFRCYADATLTPLKLIADVDDIKYLILSNLHYYRLCAALSRLPPSAVPHCQQIFLRQLVSPTTTTTIATALFALEMLHFSLQIEGGNRLPILVIVEQLQKRSRQLRRQINSKESLVRAHLIERATSVLLYKSKNGRRDATVEWLLTKRQSSSSHFWSSMLFRTWARESFGVLRATWLLAVERASHDNTIRRPVDNDDVVVAINCLTRLFLGMHASETTLEGFAPLFADSGRHFAVLYYTALMRVMIHADASDDRRLFYASMSLYAVCVGQIGASSAVVAFIASMRTAAVAHDDCAVVYAVCAALEVLFSTAAVKIEATWMRELAALFSALKMRNATCETRVILAFRSITGRLPRKLYKFIPDLLPSGLMEAYAAFVDPAAALPNRKRVEEIDAFLVDLSAFIAASRFARAQQLEANEFSRTFSLMSVCKA